MSYQVTTDPGQLDPGGAWLLDRISSRACSYYACGHSGSIRARTTWVVRLRSGTRAVELDTWWCHSHLLT